MSHPSALPLRIDGTRQGLPLERVLAVGTSGSGKTTFARRLAAELDQPHVELDFLYWGPNWQARPGAEFRALVSEALDGSRWIVDGNYGVIRDLVWPRATLVVWLNYGVGTIFARLLPRTLRRALAREELWHGNREGLRRSFFSRESILVWAASTFRRRRLAFSKLRQGGEFPSLVWVEFRAPRQAERFLRDLAADRVRYGLEAR